MTATPNTPRTARTALIVTISRHASPSGPVSAEELTAVIDSHAAEVRTAALNEAADAVAAFGWGGPDHADAWDVVTQKLRRMATPPIAPRRIQRRRIAGWRKPDGCVIVDRTSRYGNPFTLADASELGYENPRQAAVGAFDEWLNGNRDMWQADEGDHRRERILASLHLLRGRDLVCTCEPGQVCHADVLIRRANAEGANDWVTRVRARVARNRQVRGEDARPDDTTGA